MSHPFFGHTDQSALTAQPISAGLEQFLTGGTGRSYNSKEEAFDDLFADYPGVSATGLPPTGVTAVPELSPSAIEEHSVNGMHTADVVVPALPVKRDSTPSSVGESSGSPAVSSEDRDKTDIKACTCKDCGKVFNSVWYLKQHAVKHSTERPFKCRFCHKTYRFRSNLYQHKCPDRDRVMGPRGSHARSRSGRKNHSILNISSPSTSPSFLPSRNMSAALTQHPTLPPPGLPPGHADDNGLPGGPSSCPPDPLAPPGSLPPAGGGPVLPPRRVRGRISRLSALTVDLNDDDEDSWDGPPSGAGPRREPPPPPSPVLPPASARFPLHLQWLEGELKAARRGRATVQPSPRRAVNGANNNLFSPRAIHQQGLTEDQVGVFFEKHETELHKCIKCKHIFFPTREYLLRHMASHAFADSTWKCLQCSESFRSEQELNGHKAKHLPSSLHVCPACSGNFRSRLTLKKHMSLCSGRSAPVQSSSPVNPLGFIDVTPQPTTERGDLDRPQHFTPDDEVPANTPESTTVVVPPPSSVATALSALNANNDSGLGTSSGGSSNGEGESPGNPSPASLELGPGAHDSAAQDSDGFRRALFYEEPQRQANESFLSLPSSFPTATTFATYSVTVPQPVNDRNAAIFAPYQNFTPKTSADTVPSTDLDCKPDEGWPGDYPESYAAKPNDNMGTLSQNAAHCPGSICTGQTIIDGSYHQYLNSSTWGPSVPNQTATFDCYAPTLMRASSGYYGSAFAPFHPQTHTYVEQDPVYRQLDPSICLDRSPWTPSPEMVFPGAQSVQNGYLPDYQMAFDPGCFQSRQVHPSTYQSSVWSNARTGRPAEVLLNPELVAPLYPTPSPDMLQPTPSPDIPITPDCPIGKPGLPGFFPEGASFPPSCQMDVGSSSNFAHIEVPLPNEEAMDQPDTNLLEFFTEENPFMDTEVGEDGAVVVRGLDAAKRCVDRINAKKAAEKAERERKLREKPVKAEKRLRCLSCNRRYAEPKELRRHLASHALNDVRPGTPLPLPPRPVSVASTATDVTDSSEHPWTSSQMATSVRQRIASGGSSHHDRASSLHDQQQVPQRPQTALGIPGVDEVAAVPTAEGFGTVPVPGQPMSRVLTRSMTRNVRWGCDKCPEIFVNRRKLREHEMIVHREGRPYVCELCGKGFKYSSNLNDHRSVHQTEAPYLCAFCERPFKLKTNRTKHEFICRGMERRHQLEARRATRQLLANVNFHQPNNEDTEDSLSSWAGSSSTY